MQKQNGLSVTLLQRKYKCTFKEAKKILQEMLLEYPETEEKNDGRVLLFKEKER